MRRLVSHDPEIILAETEWIRQLCRSLCGQTGLGDDLAQDAIMAGLQRPLPKGATPRQWMRGIIRNRLRHLQRAHRTRVEHEGMKSEDARQEAEHPRGSSDVLDTVTRAESHRLVVAAVLELREPYRSTLLARYFDGDSVGTIAGRLNVSDGAVKTQLSRGVAQLREALRREFPPVPGEEQDLRWLSVVAPLCGAGGSSQRWAAEAASASTTSLTSVAMMMKVTGSILGVAALLIGLKLAQSSPNVEVHALVQTESTAPSGLVVPAAAGVASVAEVTQGRTLERVDEPRDEADEHGGIVPTLEVSGRIVDEFGAPVTGGGRVQVGVPIHSADWSSSPEAHILQPHTFLRGFEAQLSDGGRFRAKVPRPDGGFMVVLVHGGPQRKTVRISLSERVRDNTRPLTEGTCDLGDVMAWRTGAIYGFVRDDVGAPIEGVIVETDVDGAPGLSEDRARAITQRDGSFEILGAAPGRYRLSTEKTGYINVKTHHLDVQVGRAVRGIEIRSARAPAICGRVVDEEGQPVRGARIGGWPSEDGQHTSTTSDATGHFSLSLYGDCAHTLGVVAQGYLPWGDEDDDDTTFVASEELLLIELEEDSESSPEPVKAVAPSVRSPWRRSLAKERPGTGSLSGRFIAPDGFPCAGQLIELHYVAPSRVGGRFRNVRRQRHARVDGRGAFSFDRLTPGSYKLRYVGAALMMRRYEIDGVIVGDGPRDEIVIDARDLRLVPVHYTVDLGGMPPENGLMALTGPDQEWYPSYPTGDGSGYVSYVPPGESYVLSVGLGEDTSQFEGSLLADESDGEPAAFRRRPAHRGDRDR